MDHRLRDRAGEQQLAQALPAWDRAVSASALREILMYFSRKILCSFAVFLQATYFSRVLIFLSPAVLFLQESSVQGLQLFLEVFVVEACPGFVLVDISGIKRPTFIDHYMGEQQLVCSDLSKMRPKC